MELLSLDQVATILDKLVYFSLSVTKLLDYFPTPIEVLCNFLAYITWHHKNHYSTNSMH